MRIYAVAGNAGVAADANRTDHAFA